MGWLEEGEECLREDFGYADEDVGQDLGPDVDVRFAVLLDAIGIGGVITTRAQNVNIMLHHGRSDHRGGSKEKANCHSLNRCQWKPDLAEAGIDQVVQDRNHNDDGDGIEVLDNIVWHAVQLQYSGLRGQIAGHLVVGEEKEGEEEENFAGFETTTDFIDPGIIVGHPFGALFNGNLGGLCNIPIE